ncbi:MAG: ferritin family protein [Nitrospirae bacterium]|nr:ferritin family protein [Nitrospirota bacterium]
MNAVKIAMKMETDAIDFYRNAAEKVKNKVGKKMFLSITGDELRHLQMLTDILKGLDIKPKDVNPMKNIKTIFEELKQEMMERVEATEDELSAFKIAMDMEKEGVDFYKKAAAEAQSAKEKALFERLVKEEEQHYAVFSNTYFFMQDSGSWFMWEEYSIVDGGTPWA